jgi:hypothetical protein
LAVGREVGRWSFVNGQCRRLNCQLVVPSGGWPVFAVFAKWGLMQLHRGSPFSTAGLIVRVFMIAASH